MGFRLQVSGIGGWRMHRETTPRARLAGILARFFVVSRATLQDLKPAACSLMPGD
jgi:hypothetical protein